MLQITINQRVTLLNRLRKNTVWNTRGSNVVQIQAKSGRTCFEIYRFSLNINWKTMWKTHWICILQNFVTRWYSIGYRLLFADAARYELSKVISAHDKHHWLSMSYKGDLSQLWQNRAFCDKFCDKTVAQNCIRCDKVINISGWRKKTAL